MSTTLAQLADRAQLTLSDSGAGTWPQATVESWVLDAIRDYSQQFPKTEDMAINSGGSAPDSYSWDLTADTLGIILVEYPIDQDPPVYLKRRARTHPQFFGHQGYYDIEYSHQQESTPVLWVSQYPTTNIRVTALTHHDTDLGSSDNVTVPEYHHNLIILYVLWQAFKERLSSEEQDPDTSLAGNVTFLQQLVKGAKQAEEEYRRALQRAEQARSQSDITGPWKVDKHDPIY
jgi:hypothetical protein